MQTSSVNTQENEKAAEKIQSIRDMLLKEE
jgi:hypothetical protein